MVSLWPWKGDDTSPASFEKTLSNLSEKHKQTTAKLDGFRQQARRFKALWTLYSIFIYILYTTIDFLVLGRENWGPWEYGAVLGGPFAIYIVRAGASRYFEYRISRTQTYLDSLNKQRDETIEKLKVATRYNSTQQLLEKYGGDSPSPNNKPKSAAGKNNTKRKDANQQQQQQANTAMASGRTGLPPPPTANIRRPPPPQAMPSGPQPGSPPPNNDYYLQGKPLPPPPSSSQGYTEQQASFAPNAFPPSQSQYSGGAGGSINVGPKWYDRFLDVLLGEDEMSPKNRVVLICQNCRLVNGQAPPGIKSLEELGRWRCGGCGAWNGEESEAKKVLDSIQQVAAADAATDTEVVVKSDNEIEGEEEAGSESGDDDEPTEKNNVSDSNKSDEGENGDEDTTKEEASRSTSGVSTRTRSKRSKK